MRIFFIPLLASLSVLAACTSVAPYQAPAVPVAPWFGAAVPISTTDKAANLQKWWQQFDDPVVAELVALAQQHSPSLAQAQARIAQARALTGVAHGSLWPAVELNARANRGPQNGVTSTTSSASLDASWELDLFGGNRHAVSAAQARLESSQAQWHALRISVAAEVALSLLNYRSCHALVALQQQDLLSRQQTEQLTLLKIQAGFVPLADAALLSATLADVRQRLVAQQTECEVEFKALVALTGMKENLLRERLSKGPEAKRLPTPAALQVARLPAQVLAQRPDIASAERNVAAAHAELGQAGAARLPRFSLSGSIGVLGLHLGGNDSSSRSWSFGPGISLPIFNAGRLAAQEQAADARMQESIEAYREAVVNAVREVEQALVRLASIQQRERDAALAEKGYEKFMAAAQAQYQSGSLSLLELEDVRRNLLSARQSRLAVQREQVQAWIVLYKATGGGWSAADSQTAATTPTLTPKKP